MTLHRPTEAASSGGVKQQHLTMRPAAQISVISQPISPSAKRYVELHARLAAQLGHSDPNPIAVVSPAGVRARSELVANLAVLFARSGVPCLLLDMDFVGKAQSRLFGVQAGPGIGEWICKKQPLHCVSFDNLPELTLVPAGNSASGMYEKLSHPGFARWLRQAGGDDRVVLIDAGSAEDSSTAETIADAAGSALVALQRHGTRLDDAKMLVDRLQSRSVSTHGAVLLG